MMLTKRLAACAAQVTPGGVICDVGTDHAYLPAELLRQNRCTRAVATDIHAGPLEAARRTLTEAGVLSRAELHLCDGLEQIQPGDITDVVIAGMGSDTILHILENCPWRRQVHFILQPMTKIPVLRQNTCTLFCARCARTAIRSAACSRATKNKQCVKPGSRSAAFSLYMTNSASGKEECSWQIQLK